MDRHNASAKYTTVQQSESVRKSFKNSEKYLLFVVSTRTHCCMGSRLCGWRRTTNDEDIKRHATW